MPEFPDITIYLEALQHRVLGDHPDSVRWLRAAAANGMAARTKNLQNNPMQSSLSTVILYNTENSVNRHSRAF